MTAVALREISFFFPAIDKTTVIKQEIWKKKLRGLRATIVTCEKLIQTQNLEEEEEEDEDQHKKKMECVSLYDVLPANF